MKNFEAKNGTRFTYKEELTGKVIIDDENEGTFKVNSQDLLEFVAEYIREERITKLEETYWKDLL